MIREASADLRISEDPKTFSCLIFYKERFDMSKNAFAFFSCFIFYEETVRHVEERFRVLLLSHPLMGVRQT